MKKKMSRILSVVLSALMLISVFPLSAGAAEIIANGTCGEKLIWTLDSEGVLVISGTGEMDWFGHDSEILWYTKMDSVKKVVIESGVTSIENCVFGDTVEYVYISETVTYIYDNPFKGCHSLKEISVHNDNPLFKSEDGILYSKNMEVLRAYPAGRQDESFIVPDSVTKIDVQAFYGCDKLKEVYLPDSVTELGYVSVFENCLELVSVRLPEGITSIPHWTFFNCSKLTSVNIPETVTYIGTAAFAGCNKLASVNIHSGITFIGNSAFSGTGIATVNIHKNVTYIGTEAFGHCQKLIAIFVDKDNADFSSAEGVLYNKDKTVLLQYPAGNTANHFTVPEGVTEIAECAFRNCQNLVDVELPSTLTVIGNDAFNYCNGLTSIAIPEGVTKLFGTFLGCQNLKSVTIPESVVVIDELYSFNSVSNVFYAGTESQWENVVGHNGGFFEGATIRYNSCPHSGIVIIPAVEVSCEEDGYAEGLICPVCGVLEEPIRICATGHSFDGWYCTNCGMENTCGHKCHASGFMGFIWSIVNIFNRLFGINSVCECGAYHY